MSVLAASALPVRRLAFDPSHRPPFDIEWLVTNGLGGYASAPVAGGLSRRYHGLLIASLPAPFGRILCLTHLRVQIGVGAREFVLDHEDVRSFADPDTAALLEFRLEGGLPLWTYRAGEAIVERRVVMPYGENTGHVTFTLLEGRAGTRLLLWPFLHPRPHEGNVSADWKAPPVVSSDPNGFVVTLPDGLPSMQWRTSGVPGEPVFRAGDVSSVGYEVEQSRGYDFTTKLWTPGWIEFSLDQGQTVAFTASTEGWDRVLEVSPSEALAQELRRREALVAANSQTQDTLTAELTIAADQFLVVPVGRLARVPYPPTAADAPRSIVAGYHWFTDWGRDTMISLQGLALETGRHFEADHILRSFARHVQDGLIPNFFPEGERQGVYHTADATLWFFHALDRYTRSTGDQRLVTDLLALLVDIIEHHVAGTRFGIRVDPSDGLLTQGADHYQLTWMDAKVGDWVVTPRRGKAVEINALWYNALHVVATFLDEAGRTEQAEVYRSQAARARASFNLRFWNEPLRHLYDVVDGEQGDDPACRPNQILAVSLPHPVLDAVHWPAVLEVVERTLVTPVGLRSLAPGHPDYQAKYFGDLHARDAAYHQGTVWAWLIGPFVDAWLKVHPGDLDQARTFLNGFLPHLDEGCVGSISEVFDADSPFTPRGCIAQAWSVAEVLRVWRKTTGARP